jgi:hypothetical protein
MQLKSYFAYGLKQKSSTFYLILSIRIKLDTGDVNKTYCMIMSFVQIDTVKFTLIV